MYLWVEKVLWLHSNTCIHALCDSCNNIFTCYISNACCHMVIRGYTLFRFISRENPLLWMQCHKDKQYHQGIASVNPLTWRYLSCILCTPLPINLITWSKRTFISLLCNNLTDQLWWEQLRRPPHRTAGMVCHNWWGWQPLEMARAVDAGL